MAFHTLRRQGIHRLLTTSVRGVTRRFPGIWGFAWSANLSLTLRKSAQEFDTLLVGALTDPAAAGLYHIAKRIGRVGQQVGAQVQAVLYPDVTRLWAQGRVREFKRLIVQIEALLLALSLVGIAVIAVVIHPLLYGRPDLSSLRPLRWLSCRWWPSPWCCAARRCASGCSPWDARGGPAHGHGRNGLFFTVALLLVPTIGPMGGNIAHIALASAGWEAQSCASSRARRAEPVRSDPLDLPRDIDLLVSKGV